MPFPLQAVTLCHVVSSTASLSLPLYMKFVARENLATRFPPTSEIRTLPTFPLNSILFNCSINVICFIVSLTGICGAPKPAGCKVKQNTFTLYRIADGGCMVFPFLYEISFSLIGGPAAWTLKKRKTFFIAPVFRHINFAGTVFRCNFAANRT